MKKLLTVSLIAWTVGLLSVGTALAGEASCLVRVSYDPNQLPLGTQRINDIVGSSGVLGAAAAEAEGVMGFLKEHDLPLGDYVLADLRPSGSSNDGDNVTFGRLTVVVDEEVPHSDQQAQIILRGICNRLEDVLAEIGQQDRERLTKRVADAAQEVTRATKRLSDLQELRHTLCAEAGQADLDRDLILANCREWRGEVRHLEMRLAGLAARRDALAEQIADIGSRVEAQIDNDPVLAELAKIVELREQQLEKAEAYADARMTEGTGEAQESLAQSRAQFAERRQDAADEAGGDLLREFNQELIEIALNTNEITAQLEVLRTQLSEVSEKHLLQLADRLEREVSLYLPMVRSTVRGTIMEHEELEQRLRKFQMPTATIIGGVD